MRGNSESLSDIFGRRRAESVSEKRHNERGENCHALQPSPETLLVREMPNVHSERYT